MPGYPETQTPFTALETLTDELNASFGSLESGYPLGYDTKLSDVQQGYSPYHKYIQNVSRLSRAWPSYNGISVGSFALLEGPTLNTLPHFYSNLRKNNYPLVIAVGPSSENGDEEYFDYSSQCVSMEIHYFLKSLAAHTNRILPNVVGFNLSFLTLKFFFHPTENLYIIHIPSWPDHGLSQLSEWDYFLLTLLAFHHPNTALHCAAGLGRSATLLTAMLAFNNRVLHRPNLEEKIAGFREIFTSIREGRPLACSNAVQNSHLAQMVSSMETMRIQYPNFFTYTERSMPAPDVVVSRPSNPYGTLPRAPIVHHFRIPTPLPDEINVQTQGSGVGSRSAGERLSDSFLAFPVNSYPTATNMQFSINDNPRFFSTMSRERLTSEHTPLLNQTGKKDDNQKAGCLSCLPCCR